MNSEELMLGDRRMKLKYFYGTIEEWCELVNKKKLSQKNISGCSFYTNCGTQYVFSTYWEEVK